MSDPRRALAHPASSVTRRRFLHLSGMGVAAAFLAACGDDDSDGSGSNTTGAGAAGEGRANLSSLQIGDFSPSYIPHWTYMSALSLGYMDEVGISEIETVVSDEYIAGLISGSLDLAHGDTNVYLGSAEASGEPLKMITFYRTSEWHIMGVREGIESADDLRGATVTGGPLEGRNNWVQRRILNELGLDPDSDVQMVPTSGGADDRLAAVLTGTVDAASMFPRHRHALEEAGGQFLFEELTPAPQEAFGAMQGWLDENEDTAFAWVLGELRGRQWVKDPANKEQAYTIMRDLGYEIPPEFEDLYDVELEQISDDGGFEPDDMDQFISELVESGDVPGGIEWRDHVDFTYLWAAQDELGLPRRPDPDSL
ncbi:MAG: ABC transporter substrate-binding protein [Acidimicrobiales bacterium]